ncbi:sarcosine oxidase [Okibacterium sp. HSC-33S16]|uniref:N-methyl-L-tryptophan oxidase n=1 Tax=Okibacterium sp. HSC-33S16 TaxID=2910965 RepID=UPI0020A159B1|nr:N-methyl-L-tryptophan oxidase [Okibacterium sp. HSC-33S16]MCP2032130.1 sarcosine oxidase [Okibacterium sp. HSC-33S16]
MDAQEVDLAVVGLGAAGSQALLSAARRGASVLGIEQFSIAHDRGSSHGHSRLFRGGASEGPLYVDLARRSRELWEEAERQTGREILTLVSGLTLGSAESELIETTRAALEARGLPHETLDADEVRSRFPQHLVRDSDIGLIDPATGVVRPELSIATAVELAVDAGATVWANTPVTRVDDDGSRVVIDTERGRVVARKVILAAGAWNSTLLPDEASSFTVRRAILTWFLPRGDDWQHFAPDRFPVFTRDLDGVRGWGAPAIDDLGVKVGLQDQAGYSIENPSDNRRDVTPDEVQRVEAFVARQFGGALEPQAVHARGCMITVTPDEHFVVGPSASHPNIVLLAACSGHGFKHSPAIGEIGADLALDGDSPFDLSLFAPSRFH